MVVKPRVTSSLSILGLPPARLSDQQQVLSAILRSDEPARVVAVQLRKPEVQKNHIGTKLDRRVTASSPSYATRMSLPIDSSIIARRSAPSRLSSTIKIRSADPGEPCSCAGTCSATITSREQPTRTTLVDVVTKARGLSQQVVSFRKARRLRGHQAKLDRDTGISRHPYLAGPCDDMRARRP